MYKDMESDKFEEKFSYVIYKSELRPFDEYDDRNTPVMGSDDLGFSKELIRALYKDAGNIIEATQEVVSAFSDQTLDHVEYVYSRMTYLRKRYDVYVRKEKALAKEYNGLFTNVEFDASGDQENGGEDWLMSNRIYGEFMAIKFEMMRLNQKIFEMCEDIVGWIRRTNKDVVDEFRRNQAEKISKTLENSRQVAQSRERRRDSDVIY